MLVTHKSVQETLGYDANLNSRVMKSFYDFPFIEQLMVAEVGLIRIASEACFASFDQSIVGVWQKILSSDS